MPRASSLHPQNRNRRTRTRTAGALFESMESRTLLSTYTVTNTNDSGSGSLRQAILNANKSSTADVIAFKIGSGQKTISPHSALPTITQPVTVDGSTQPGFAGKPLVEISGSYAGSGTNGLKVMSTNVTIKGLIINRFSGSGVFLYMKGSDKVVGNWIGVDKYGGTAAANKGHGVFVQAANNTIGGTTTADRNVISGNSNAGVYFYTGVATKNKVLGNYIGTDATGSKGIANHNGVQSYCATSNTIGGTASGSRNIISGNTNDGVLINGTGANYNTVQGNYIGTNAGGTAKVRNGWYGVEISQSYNTVGGTVAAARNVISGNGMDGVSFYLASGTHNVCQGNYIGTDYTGTKDLGNAWAGVSITNDAKYNTVGGSTSAACNIISGNDQYGVGVYNHSTNNTVSHNCIGISVTGKSLPNTKNPISVWISTNNTITYNKIVLGGKWTPIQISSGLTTTLTGNTLYGIIASGVQVM